MPDSGGNSGGIAVRCPVCGDFLARVQADRAKIELNCKNKRCRATVLIEKTLIEITTTTIRRPV